METVSGHHEDPILRWEYPLLSLKYATVGILPCGPKMKTELINLKHDFDRTYYSNQ